MPRTLFIAALVVGLGYTFAHALLGDGVVQVIWKGAGVGLLTAWIATRARAHDGWLLTIAFAIYAAADVALEFSRIGGAATFIAGHAAMILLYARHRRPIASEDWMIAGLMLVGIPIAAFLLPDQRGEAVQVAIYAVVLGGMATAAWLSDFRRDRVLLGAMLFVLSDLLIFARLGALRGSAIPGMTVWPLYFIGQALIARGVGDGLNASRH